MQVGQAVRCHLGLVSDKGFNNKTNVKKPGACPVFCAETFEIYYLLPIVRADRNAVCNDSRAISFMRPENVRIFIVFAKFLVKMFAIYSICAGEIIKMSLVISFCSSCFICVFIRFPLFFLF